MREQLDAALAQVKTGVDHTCACQMLLIPCTARGHTLLETMSGVQRSSNLSFVQEPVR
jgi:hypothetical protein